MPDLSSLRVAIAHHWFVARRGGEKVVDAIAAMFPDAPLFALAADPETLPPELRRRPIHTSFLQTLACWSGSHRHWLALFPQAAESLDATAYDLVICSDAATIKGIRTRPDAIKICYCHSPMRYVWGQGDDYAAQSGAAGSLALRLLGPRLRRWDRQAAQGVTAFVANSRHVAERIRQCYGREARVIYPPVDTDAPPALEKPDDFYLVVGEQVEYKRNDLAIEACARTNRKLVVIGDGPLLARFRRQFAERPNIRFLGRQPDDVLRAHYRRCRALLFCGQEDFGIVPVEAMAAGRPVIAYGHGGATESIVPGVTGILFDRQEPDAVEDAINQSEKLLEDFEPAAIQRHAASFATERFQKEFRQFVEATLKARERSPSP